MGFNVVMYNDRISVLILRRETAPQARCKVTGLREAGIRHLEVGHVRLQVSFGATGSAANIQADAGYWLSRG